MIHLALLYCLGIFPVFASEFNYNKDVFFKEMASPLVEPPATYTFYSGAALTLATVLTKTITVDPVQREMTERNRFGKYEDAVGYMGQVIPNALYTGAMLIGGLSSNDMSYYSHAMVMAKATVYSSIVTTVLKHTIREKRPDGGNHLSFPSGHSAMIFSFAGVIGALHPWYFAVPAYAMAALVGAQRMSSNNHYLHDVIAGATIGTSYALGVATLTKQKSSPITTQVIPIPDGLFVSMDYRF